MKKRSRVLKKRSRVLKKRSRVLKKRSRVLNKRSWVKKEKKGEIAPTNFGGAKSSRKGMAATRFQGRVSMYAAVIATYGACFLVPRLLGYSQNIFRAFVF